ncbi:hypothetical protein NADFUDRAFT_45764 [Nadsonia fulvescens var. elongata DSM 6958]|uniref:Uncharacterized protein n=1 Tax=Nadsonia fulvescens var. elongata DSM 6958 TaxID=857566 RepID=A0A1E3PMS9_9ASCO|nr:hypothetical protein NADFUDRAFT_45764 [Nadsonia fulvescens var. elongata DSM 6958]
MEDLTINSLDPEELISGTSAHGRHWLITESAALDMVSGDANRQEYMLNDSDDEDYDDDDSYSSSDAQQEWEESLKQLDHMIMYILVPLVGKFFGRKFSKYAWGNFLSYLYPNVRLCLPSSPKSDRSLLSLFGLASK